MGLDKDGGGDGSVKMWRWYVGADSTWLTVGVGLKTKSPTDAWTNVVPMSHCAPE